MGLSLVRRHSTHPGYSSPAFVYRIQNILVNFVLVSPSESQVYHGWLGRGAGHGGKCFSAGLRRVNKDAVLIKEQHDT